MHHAFSPLPGSPPPPRGLFIDRWGTLLELPRKGFCARFDSARFTPGAVDALFHASQAGWKLYLLGNEDSVAFGKLTEPKWKRFEEDMLEHLRSHGVPIQRNYACLDHPEGVEGRQNDSVFLLPNTGALYHAAQVDSIVLGKSWVIGDSTLELVAGWRAGTRLAAVRTGLALTDASLSVDPEVHEADLASVLQEIGAGERMPR